ncbi:IS629 ORF1 [Shigella boydii Sb227]|uniref:IS629 ORF1 n=3 Tax=Shigella boydii TaxID=621 RepID=Q325P0_SHIBS|nr:IS629 ORF1 [Shigella boydii Sb227]
MVTLCQVFGVHRSSYRYWKNRPEKPDGRRAVLRSQVLSYMNRPGNPETKLPEKEVNRMTKNTRFSPEVRQRAIRMVLESQGEYDSQWAAICSIAPKIGCTPETLRVWVRQHERDTGGGDGGLTTAKRQRLKELERENRELRRSNDILRQASAYFAKAEFDRLWKK